MAVAFHHPVLIGDIGGTNARFAVLPAPDEPLIDLPRTLTAQYSSPVEAVRAVLAGFGAPKPRSAVLAVAARVEGPVVRMTNAPWTIDAAAIGAALDLERVSLVNDYVPVAAALRVLRSQDLARLGPECAPEKGPMLVLGPGTGLGAAALLPVGDRWAVVPTEAGHTEFGPAADDEAAVWPRIERVADRVTAEVVLSGPGLVRLYRALAGGADELVMPGDVSAAGLSGEDARAVETLDLFARLLGRFAGDLALTFGATGGVFIAGGIAPRMIAVLDRGAFRAAFERKAPQDAFARRVPTWAILHPEPALLGLSALAGQDDDYIYPCASSRV